MVVFFDIDGTVVDNETQQIPDSTVRAIEKLNQNGHIPVVNTGRPFAHIDPRVRELAFQGWVCGCGMELRLQGQRVFFCTPDDELCLYVRDLARECDMRPLYELEIGAIELDPGYEDHPAIRLEASQMRQKGFAVRKLAEPPKFMKLVTFDSPNSQRGRFLAEMGKHFTCIDRGNTMVEFVMKGCSKAAGMQKMLEILGVSPDDTIAIGDSTNDLPMFSVAKHTVCMGGGMGELKQAAEYVTANVMDDGIEKALRHFGLIR